MGRGESSSNNDFSTPVIAAFAGRTVAYNAGHFGSGCPWYYSWFSTPIDEVFMALVTYIKHDGSSYELEVAPGTSVMQAAVDNLLDGIVGECGGSCSCATCHCYVDAAWVDKLPKPDGMEQDMLECVLEPQANSRLSCQIVVNAALDGLVIRLPESQF
jgi:ferredoxin, 2Fe-2S